MTDPATVLLMLKRVDCNDGIASYLETLITGLRAVGDRVVIVSGEVTTLYGSEVRRRSIEDAALDWIVIPQFEERCPALSHITQILAVIERYNVDVVSPQGFAALPIGYAVGKLSRRPIVTNYHPSMNGNEADLMSGSIPTRQKLMYLALGLLCRSDRYIAMSTDIENFFLNTCQLSRRLIHKQMLGVETDFYRAPTEQERSAARARFSLPNATLVAVLPGRMNLNKGHDVAAAAFRLLRERRPEAGSVCLFPGDGDQRAQIESSVLKDGGDVAMFRFLGFVTQNILRDTYWAADIILLPSRREGFGLVVAEAMCCGSIVIRTPSGGCQDQVIEGITGYSVPFNDPEALSIAIEHVLDSPERARMREAAMSLASTSFAKRRMIEGTSALYRNTAAKQNSPRAAPRNT